MGNSPTTMADAEPSIASMSDASMGDCTSNTSESGSVAPSQMPNLIGNSQTVMVDVGPSIASMSDTSLHDGTSITSGSDSDSPPQLSNELYYEIFKFLEPLERQRLREVSKKWRHVIEKEFGIQFIITTDNWSWTSRSREICSAIFRSFTFPIKNSVCAVTLPTLRVVKFSKILLGRNLISILQKCSQIETLEFDDIVLDNGVELNAPYELRLPQLKSIEFSHYSKHGFDSDAQRAAGILFQYLTSIKYDKLQKVCFWCPTEYLEHLPINVLFCNSLGESNTHWLLELVLANRHTVRKLTLGHPEESVTFGLLPSINGIEVRKPMQLHTIVSEAALPPTWEYLLMSQQFIGRLVLLQNAFHLWTSQVSKAVAQSKEVIQLLSCHGGGTAGGDSVDLGVLADCKHLEGLELKYNFVRLLSINTLPISLRILRLNGPLNKYDFASIGRRLVNLENLDIDNGETLAVGVAHQEVQRFATVDLDIFKKLLSLAKLKHLSLVNCKLGWTHIVQWCRVTSSLQYDLECAVLKNVGNTTPIGLKVKILQRKGPIPISLQPNASYLY